MPPDDPETWVRTEGVRGYVLATAIQPTQTAHPWRATVRTVVAAIVALLPALPTIVAELGIASVPWIAVGLTVVGGVTRVLAIPAVNAWITEYMPWLAPTPRRP